MRFAFTEDQLEFRAAVADLLAKECTPEVVRAAWPAGTDAHGARKGEGARADVGEVARVWQALAEMGVLAVAVPEEHDGLGLGELDWVLLAEETGYHALPHPFVETACVVAPLLAELGDPTGDLAALVTGERQAGAVSLGSTLVPWGDSIGYLLSLDRDGATGAWEARRIEGGLAAGGDRALADSLDGGRHLVQLHAWKTSDPFGTAEQAERAFLRGALGTAAQLVGASRRLLDLTVGYVTERRQFGVPIGSQQAVKHHLAEVALRLRFAAPAVYAAAWALQVGDPDAAREVATAKALASDAATTAVRRSLQCHGAIGYTVEYDLHLYLKRAEALARTWGDPAWHRRQVATYLGI